MLDSFANRLSLSFVQRHLLFLLAALFAILFVGYHFGTFDQAVHIPFLKKYADPGLYPGDCFLDLRLQHYSFFWFFFLPFYRLGMLEAAMFVTHVATTYATFWALWHLSETLFHDPIANLIVVVALAFPHVGFSAFPLFEFSLLNRSFVLPFLILALGLYLRRRYGLAFFLIGLMYNLHAVSVHFVLAMFLLDCALEFRKVGWRSILGGLIAFLIGALPVLIWRQNNGPVDFSLRPEWLSIIARGTFYHLFYFITPYLYVQIVVLSGLSTLILFFAGRRHGPSLKHDRTMTNFVAAGLLILAAQAIATNWLPVTIVIESQIMRAGLFLLIFGYLYFARYLAARYRAGAGNNLDFGALTGALIVSPFPFMPLIVFAAERLISSARWRQAATVGGSIVLFAGSITLALHYRVWHPGIYIYPRRTAWYRAQMWAKENTPREAVFIVPPHEWWFYESDWRVFSERSPVATHAELLEAAFAPEYLDIWIPRFEAVAPGALARFRGDFFENLEITAEAYGGLSPGDFLRVARQYQATYVVVEKPHRCGFQMVYENEQFTICDVRSRDSSP